MNYGLLGEEYVINADDIPAVTYHLRQYGREPDCREGEALGAVYDRHGLTVAERARLWCQLCLFHADKAEFGSWERAQWTLRASKADSVHMAATRASRQAAERQEHKKEE